MIRTKLRDRILPDYTRGEEIFNMVTHIVGGGFGVIALVVSVLVSALKGSVWGVVGCSVYGATMVILYTMSSVYHGLKAEMPKKVMQVLDHCTIYLLIAGTYTPILLCAVRPVSPFAAWGLFALVWGFAVLGGTFTAIDLKKYSVFAMICYIGMGWSVVLAAKPTLQAIPLEGLAWLLAGGIAYTVGAVFYGFGRKCRYIHSVFHIFVVLGSILQYICILFYVI
ncbi:MAG: hemolysin III family protein [Clostridia bacterium]|nr:hemolysin III family protein [Clostridia bacterium]